MSQQNTLQYFIIDVITDLKIM